MTKWHVDSGKKITGGIVRAHRKKKRRELGSMPTHTSVGAERHKVSRMRGGESKTRVVTVQYANVYDPGAKKTAKSKIIGIVQNPANVHYARRGILTKGCVIKTEAGNARVTSRPSQHGIVNAVLVEEKRQ